MDIKYYALVEWVEHDLVALERVCMAQNMADHCTKPLPRILFYHHVDYIMGHVPPPYSPLYTTIIPLLADSPAAAAAAKLVCESAQYLYYTSTHPFFTKR